jgi:hypothetical protein
MIASAPIAEAQVASNVTGRPDLRAFVPEDRVTPGTEPRLSVFVDNRGELFSRGPDEFERLVQTARSATVTVRAVDDGDDSPIEVLTSEQPVGDLAPGVAGPFPVRVRVADDAPPGAYRLTVVVRYEYTDRVRIGSDGTDFFEEAAVDRLPLVVRVAEGARFVRGGDSGPDDPGAVATAVPVGTTGPLTLQLRNAGSDPALDATVRVRSGDPELTFGDGAAVAESYVGDWPAGASRTATVRVRFAADALVREYGLVATVAYRTVDGDRVESSPVAIGVRPAAGPSLRVTGVGGDLRAGESGTIRGVVTNEGDAPARDVVVRVTADSTALTPTEPVFPVGEVAPGAAAPFTVPVSVARDADPGPRRVAVTVERRVGTTDAETAGTRTSTTGATIEVAAARDPFVVEPVAASLAVDATGTLTVRVTNAGDEPVRNVQIAMAAGPPLESEAPAAFVPSLAAGASTEVSFPLEAVAEAVPGTNAVELTFTYEDAAGDDRTTDPYLVPVAIVPEPTGDVLLPAALAVVALVAVGVWYWRRR